MIWQILDYYFVKLTGTGGDNLREQVLITNRENFIQQLPNGVEDNSKWIMASKLLTYMGTTANESDEAFYADNDVDVESYRETFAMVFTAMEQDQHYRMMMADNDR